MHESIGTSASQPQARLPDQFAALEVSSKSSAFNKCSVCDKEVHLDLNTGNLSTFCKLHLKQHPDLQFDSSEEEDMMSVGGATARVPSECAIDECRLPCYVDANGTVHDCCGYTHAMELIRRQVISSKLCAYQEDLGGSCFPCALISNLLIFFCIQFFVLRFHFVIIMFNFRNEAKANC